MEKLKNILSSSSKIVLDTGVWLTYFLNENEDISSLLDKYLFSDATDLITIGNAMMISEIYYILCRKLGNKRATTIINFLMKTIQLSNTYSIMGVAGKIKCMNSISLVDCYSIATGIIHDCCVVFNKENELQQEIINGIEKNFSCNLIVV